MRGTARLSSGWTCSELEALTHVAIASRTTAPRSAKKCPRMLLALGVVCIRGCTFYRALIDGDWAKENVFWEERGLGEFGGKELVRNQLGIICAGAATVAPCLVTAAVPRDLRVDPCEEKSKRDEFSRIRQRSVDARVVAVYLVNMTVAIFYSGNEAPKFAEMCTSG